MGPGKPRGPMGPGGPGMNLILSEHFEWQLLHSFILQEFSSTDESIFIKGIKIFRD
jgi:hypothetical protein